MKLAHAAAVIVLAAAPLACSTNANVARDPSVQHDFETRADGLQAAESAKDLDRIMTYWAPDAVIHVAGAPPIQGTAAIRKGYEGLLPTCASLQAERTAIAVAASGDVAYETGTNHLMMNTPSGPTPATSKYLIVWERHAGEPWLVKAISVTNNP